MRVSGSPALAGPVCPVFPWRPGNQFRLLVDGPQFFPVMLAALDQARDWAVLEFYLVEDGQCAGRLVSALVAAARRGVRVRCLFDGFGCLKLAGDQRMALMEAGVVLRLYNPLVSRWHRQNFHRDHRKLLLVDGQCGFIGGAGITDEFWNPQQPGLCWHEVMVEVRGPLLQDWLLLFDRQWARVARRYIWQLPLPGYVLPVPPLPAEPGGMGRLAYSAARQHLDVLRSLLQRLARARRRIWLATPYFLPTGKVRRALVRAARHGVEVQLLLTSQNTDHPPVRYAGQRYYTGLLQAGIRIYEYQPAFLHLKMVLVDDWVSLGSCNFDHWNLLWNLEANLESTDPGLVQAVATSFARDFALSHEVRRADWQCRPWWTRFYQFLFGRLDRLLMNLFNQRH